MSLAISTLIVAALSASALEATASSPEDELAARQVALGCMQGMLMVGS